MFRLKTPRAKSIPAMAWVTLLLASSGPQANAEPEFGLRALSSRPDAVSGGDVLLEADVPAQSGWTVKLNGHDITAQFHLVAGSNKPEALISGLELGQNELILRVKTAMESKLEILNHPRQGPIFSGPHQEPFICQTDVNGLGPATDADCNARTIVKYYYKSTQPSGQSPLQAVATVLEGKVGELAPGFKSLDPSKPVPDDVAATVTSNGQIVPYIVRREIGVLNRAVYQIQFLHVPGQPLPTPWTEPTPGWNGRLVYDFGGGCSAGYRQGTILGVIGGHPMLELGYAVATSTLNILGNNCNDRISAETLTMVKEHFIKQYGMPTHTIGEGASGGAIQQYLIAQNYPGLLDGIVVSDSFPDIATWLLPVTDCLLLDYAFNSSTDGWTDAQKTAVSGYATWRVCQRLSKWPVLDPKYCDHEIANGSMPGEEVYDRVANPRGVRCDYYGNEINVFGRDLRTGFARRPLDNVGVQYGLSAFNRGEIGVRQFLDLNEDIGGLDEDGNWVRQRTEADPEAVSTAYRSGVVLTGGGGLSKIPIIDWHVYVDDEGDNHDHVRALMTRARLIAANGTAANQVILVDPPISLLSMFDMNPATSPTLRRGQQLVGLMDHWLDHIVADHGTGNVAEKISRNLPAGLADGCVAINGETIVERASADNEGRCNKMYPLHGDPRLAAGTPFPEDILKCRLKPVDPYDYTHPLSAEDLERLRAIFPTGVCDYSRAGIGQQVFTSTWPKFTPEPQLAGGADVYTTRSKVAKQ